MTKSVYTIPPEDDCWHYYRRIDYLHEITPIIKISLLEGDLKFITRDYQSLQRAENIKSQEPITLSWIRTFKAGEIFWDIGANIGCFSLFAGLRKIQVYAFEPSAWNYLELTQNIILNKLDNVVSAYCLAINDKEIIGTLNLGQPLFGGAVNTFAPAKKDTIAFNKKHVDIKAHQGMLSCSIDFLVDTFKLPVPNHIKIDVDGLEKQVLWGANVVLKHPNLSSIMVEIDESDKDEQKEFFDLFSRYNLKFQKKQLLYGSIGNFLFVRK